MMFISEDPSAAQSGCVCVSVSVYLLLACNPLKVAVICGVIDQTSPVHWFFWGAACS